MFSKLNSEVTNENFRTLGTEKVEITQSDSNCEMTMKILNWWQNYFVSKQVIELDICPEIANPDKFRQKVWLILKENVHFGQTISYGELASLSGSPKACQSVGSAMSNNPISLVIPCHRVIKSDGKIGNYSKATKNDIKEWLLNFECGSEKKIKDNCC